MHRQYTTICLPKQVATHDDSHDPKQRLPQTLPIQKSHTRPPRPHENTPRLPTQLQTNSPNLRTKPRLSPIPPQHQTTTTHHNPSQTPLPNNRNPKTPHTKTNNRKKPQMDERLPKRTLPQRPTIQSQNPPSKHGRKIRRRLTHPAAKQRARPSFYTAPSPDNEATQESPSCPHK